MKEQTAGLYAEKPAGCGFIATDASHQGSRGPRLLYFQTFSKRPFPDDVEASRHSLAELKANDPLAK